MKKIVLIAGMTTLIAGGGFFAWRSLRTPDTQESTASRTAVSEDTAADPAVAFVDVKEVTVRLADPNFEHYMKVTPVLAVKAGSQEEVESRMPVVRDMIVRAVAGMSSHELMTPEGNARLKERLLRMLNRDLNDAVAKIYFSRYLVE